jgi:hypothetical protein
VELKPDSPLMLAYVEVEPNSVGEGVLVLIDQYGDSYKFSGCAVLEEWPQTGASGEFIGRRYVSCQSEVEPPEAAGALDEYAKTDAMVFSHVVYADGRNYMMLVNNSASHLGFGDCSWMDN